jgi:hypothetical protein
MVNTSHGGAPVCMAFKLTYSDGQESQYDDDTKWEVDDGVLKLGKKEGKWSVLLSPSHWAVIEVGGAKSEDSDDGKDENDSDKDESDNDEKANKDNDSDDGDDAKKDD